MNIKRVKHCLYYREAKITEYALLTEFSPKFINSKIKGIKLQIEAMYYIRSNGAAVDSELINRLRCDLYKAIHSHKVGVKV